MQNRRQIVAKKSSRILALIFSVSVVVPAVAQNGSGICGDGSNIANITRVLNLCSEVSQFMQQRQQRDLTLMSTEVLARASGIERTVRIAELQLNEATIRYTQSVAAQAHSEAVQQKRLQIATAIVGIIAGGAGGGLHLVNNPHLAHFGTALAMGAGVTGGSLGLVGGLTKSIPPAGPNGNYVEAFFRSYSMAGARGTSISEGLVEMGRQLEALENQLQ